jgi:hypothetical protein
MLGAADSMLRLEMKEDAISVLRQLVERYPKTEPAAKARARLAELAPPPASDKKAPEKKGPEKKGSEKKKGAARPEPKTK